MTTPKAPNEGGHEFDSQQLIKIGIDLVPLLVFFAVFMTLGLRWATGVLMVTSLIAMVVSRIVLGKISATLMISTGMVIAFGALALLFDDTRFIKMKPTIVYLLFAGALFGGLMVGRPVLQTALGEALPLTPEGWTILSRRWGFFFIAMAALNELIWRNLSEATWASFKVFGFLPLTVLFIASQYNLIEKYRIHKVDNTTDKTAL